MGETGEPVQVLIDEQWVQAKFFRRPEKATGNYYVQYNFRIYETEIELIRELDETEEDQQKRIEDLQPIEKQLLALEWSCQAKEDEKLRKIDEAKAKIKEILGLADVITEYIKRVLDFENLS